MNKRIKELAEQADYKSLSPPTFADELNEIFMQKFAELIVRECAQFIFVLDSEPVSHQSAARMLMDHFGVK